MKKLIFTLSLICFYCLGEAQEVSDNFNMSFNVANISDIRIHNFKGDVTVKGTSGSKFELKVKRILKSKSRAKLKAAQSEVYLDTTIIDGEFIVFVNAPDKHFKMDDDGNSYYNGNDWNNWSKDDIKDYGVEYEFIIEATVPASSNLYAATHHKDVNVSKINGNTTVKSHHGNVEAETGGNIIVAKSHHGDVLVKHSSRNVSQGTYKTHHGDIRTSFPEVSADVTMKSHHGSFYVDFDYKHTAQKIKLQEEGRKTKYKIGDGTSIRIGSGGGKFTYATHHGNTYISKI